MNALKTQNQFLCSKVLSQTLNVSHRHLISGIENLKCSKLFKSVNYINSTYVSPQNKILKSKLITKKGLLFYVCGLTGDKGAEIKEIIFSENLNLSNIIETIKDMDVEDLPIDRYIYIAQESISKRYKVGISKHPEERVKQLNIGNPEHLNLISYYFASEKGYLSEVIAHEKLKLNHIRSEWFSDISELRLEY